ncbi:MAG: hypothetical protein ACLP9L_10835 [Thermoguttaceae bacterium]
MPNKPPLIASQRLLVLDLNVPNPVEFLRPDRFRGARVPAAGGQTMADPDATFWHAVSFQDLSVNSDRRRLCLTTGAGIGKSTVLLRARHEIMQANPRMVAIYVRLRDLPWKTADYLHETDDLDRSVNPPPGYPIYPRSDPVPQRRGSRVARGLLGRLAGGMGLSAASYARETLPASGTDKDRQPSAGAYLD